MIRVLSKLIGLVVRDGGKNSPPSLLSLFNALDLSSCHSNVLSAANTVAISFLESEEATWLTSPSIVSSYNFGIKQILA